MCAIKDKKYDLMKHPNVKLIEDGGAESEKKKTNENSDETNSTDSEGEHINDVQGLITKVDHLNI